MYQGLAHIYDRHQRQAWPLWADFIQALDAAWSDRSGGDGSQGRPILLDLGCGTGGFCLEMARRGYDPIGLDRSADMLAQAQEKARAQTDQGQAACLFLHQDITAFELYGTVDLAVCLMDTVNHLLTEEAVRQMLQLCHHYLNPGCLLVLDLLTHQHLQQTLGKRLFVEDQADYTLLWQNDYEAATQMNQARTTLFLKDENKRYRRFDDRIQERYHDPEAVASWARDAGFQTIGSSAFEGLSPPRPHRERTFCLFKKGPIKPPEAGAR